MSDTLQDEVLHLYIFTSLREVIEQTESWIELYNTERPHDSLNDIIPVKFKLAA